MNIVNHSAEFWRTIELARELIEAGDSSAARDALLSGYKLVAHETGRSRRNHERFLSIFAQTFDIQLEQDLQELENASRQLGSISRYGVSGVSLVTCCKNRNDNLFRALPSWTAHPDISEIVIVDWCSDDPVEEDMISRGLSDGRIRVVRVDDEPRWILSYAFNVGFRAASCERILKVDADIVLSEDFFEKNVLDPNTFIAGNWRRAEEGQQYINGFFYLMKSDLAHVGGFNEFITTYGWDDDELYHRLLLEGVGRKDVDVHTVHHLPHDDTARTGREDDAALRKSAAETLKSTTHFFIRRNRFITNAMPSWSGQSQFLPFDIDHEAPEKMVLHRTGWTPVEVPQVIHDDAEFYALSELASWRLGLRVRQLSREGLDRLLAKELDRLTNLDIEVARSRHPEAIATGRRYIVCRLEHAQIVSPSAKVVSALALLREQAERHGLTPVLSAPFESPPEDLNEAFAGLPMVCSWLDLGGFETIDLTRLRRARVGDLSEGEALLVDLRAPGAADGVMHIQTPRRRIFIDAQHGMGNRLRAIGSAASIAEKTDRELVIVWQPDMHCECRFADLFDYDGAVIEESFVTAAPQLDFDVYNYMEVEGGRKDVQIDASSVLDLYARSAFVLNSPLSNWDDENRFLRGLRPVEEVLDMIAGVRHPNDVSAHVRMEAGQGRDNNAYDSPDGNWSEGDHELIHHWRAKSHFSHFLARIDALFEAGEAATLFLAADLPETYEVFLEHYGERLAFLPRDVYDRSAAQLRYGLADAILLGRSNRLLGSTWSSFSELAMRMAPTPQTTEMSGKDF